MATTFRATMSKAYDYFSQIVASYDEDNPDRRDLAIVSSAFVALGIYNLNGVANSKLRPDPQRALQMFQFAATFGDANAQYHLARLHLEGAGVDKDGREAIRWLFLAADKGHLQARALLGQRCTKSVLLAFVALATPSSSRGETRPLSKIWRRTVPTETATVVLGAFRLLKFSSNDVVRLLIDVSATRRNGTSREQTLGRGLEPAPFAHGRRLLHVRI